jgi:transcriptional regulator with XRE-family HTH domain
MVLAPQKMRDARLSMFPPPAWSLRRVAKELLKIKPQTLSMYETGKASPGAIILARMCVLYSVTVEELTQIDLSA